MLLAGSLIVTGFFSCKKDNDSPKSKTELLTAKLWKISSVGIDLDKNNTVDLPYPMENCDKDNTFEFKADGKGITYEGATKCDPDDPDSENFTWSFKNEETVLSIAIPGSVLSGDATIIKLNGSTLEAYMDYNNGAANVRAIFKLTH